jgi:hypothetical protein
MIDLKAVKCNDSPYAWNQKTKSIFQYKNATTATLDLLRRLEREN